MPTHQVVEPHRRSRRTPGSWYAANFVLRLARVSNDHVLDACPSRAIAEQHVTCTTGAKIELEKRAAQVCLRSRVTARKCRDQGKLLRMPRLGATAPDRQCDRTSPRCVRIIDLPRCGVPSLAALERLRQAELKLYADEVVRSQRNAAQHADHHRVANGTCPKLAIVQDEATIAQCIKLLRQRQVVREANRLRAKQVAEFAELWVSCGAVGFPRGDLFANADNVVDFGFEPVGLCAVKVAERLER